MTDIHINPASYKDPAGFVFEHNGHVYRHVSKSYAHHYDLLMQSGLYTSLTAKNWLISHTEINENFSRLPDFYKTLFPVQLSFISYPYEWSFDMLKDAALLTLQVCTEAIRYGMVLKDASAFNIQFINSQPVFIDTLSFEKYDASQPWIAYRQFCEMFLSPLLLTYFTGIDMNKWLLTYPEGIPVNLCSRLLPFRTKLNMLSLLHIHLQASVKTDKKASQHAHEFSKQKLLNVLQHLTKGIEGISASNAKSTWSDYYTNTIKGQDYLDEKQQIFSRLLQQVSADSAVDLGANNGLFSKIMAEKNMHVVATDFDNQPVNDLYRELKKQPGLHILPLVIDISNPSPSIGWENKERISFLRRGRYDLVVALALIHHLAISKNISLQQIAACFYKMCNKFLIVEYIDKEDEKVKLLLERKNITYDQYTKAEYEKQFSRYFQFVTSTQLSQGNRTLYLWKVL